MSKIINLRSRGNAAERKIRGRVALRTKSDSQDLAGQDKIRRLQGETAETTRAEKYGTPQLPIFFVISELFLLILSYCFSFYIINILNIYRHFFFYIPSIFFYIIDFLLDHHFSIKPLFFIIFQQIFSTMFLTIAFLSYHRKIIFFYMVLPSSGLAFFRPSVQFQMKKKLQIVAANARIGLKGHFRGWNIPDDKNYISTVPSRTHYVFT